MCKLSVVTGRCKEAWRHGRPTGTVSARPAQRTVLDIKPRDHVTAAVQELHWLPVAERIQFKLCFLVHKSLLGHTPEYISDLLTSVSDVPARSAVPASSSGNLVVLRTRRRIGDRAFSVAEPRAWNTLTTQLKLLRSTTNFRRQLKIFVPVCLWIQTDACFVMRPRSPVAGVGGYSTNTPVTVTVENRCADG